MRARLRRCVNPSYEDLLAERDRLKEIVLYWRYPDGSLVPQGKRRRFFYILGRVKRALEAHPDNPAPPARRRSLEEALKYYYDPDAHGR